MKKKFAVTALSLLALMLVSGAVAIPSDTPEGRAAGIMQDTILHFTEQSPDCAAQEAIGQMNASAHRRFIYPHT